MSDQTLIAGEDIGDGCPVFIDEHGRVRALPTETAPEGVEYVDEVSSYEQFGAVRLRRKPQRMLIDAEGFSLPFDATLEQYQIAADWIRIRGGNVGWVNEDGILVGSVRDEETGRRYWEFMQAPCLIKYTPEHQEFTTYGNTIMTEYAIERLS